MLLPLDLHGRLYCRDDRGSRLEANLSRYRRVGDVMAVIPVEWSGFRFNRLRCSVVRRTGALPGETLGILGPDEAPGSPV